MFVDLWDHFSYSRSIYGKDGLHLNRVGKARLGRVLVEHVNNKICQVIRLAGPEAVNHPLPREVNEIKASSPGNRSAGGRRRPQSSGSIGL